MSLHIPVPAIITALTFLTDDTVLFEMQVEPGHPVAGAFTAGQFVQLSLPGVGEIPVSYCGYPAADGRLELCVRRTGRVTTALLSVKAGCPVALRGPFGRGFPLADFVGHDILLLAGGVGMAPLRSLLKTLLAERERYGRIQLCYGVRSADRLLFMDELREYARCGLIQLQCALEVVSPANNDTASLFREGLLPVLLSEPDLAVAGGRVAICGPPVSYPALINRLQSMSVPENSIYLSLERHMKCGIGRCGHCALGSLLCCVDGPVFTLGDLAGIEGAIG